MPTNNVTRRLKRLARIDGGPLKEWMRETANPGMVMVDYPAPRHHEAVVGARCWLARKGIL